jgi:Trk K+ transport system NAD-binding subunit
VNVGPRILNGRTVIPRGSVTLAEGDRLILVAGPGAREAVLKTLRRDAAGS